MNFNKIYYEGAVVGRARDPVHEVEGHGEPLREELQAVLHSWILHSKFGGFSINLFNLFYVFIEENILKNEDCAKFVYGTCRSMQRRTQVFFMGGIIV